MYLESIEFKRNESSEWEDGYYVADYQNSENSIILDKKFIPVNENPDKDVSKWRVWDYRPNIKKRLCFNVDTN